MATITKTYTETTYSGATTAGKHTLVLPFPNKTVTQSFDGVKAVITPETITDQCNTKADGRTQLISEVI